jgi:hypothetical protein
MTWKTAVDVPTNVMLMTKIDDEHGVRNVQILYRSGNLWFMPENQMYIYYAPTHYRELTESEKIGLLRSLSMNNRHSVLIRVRLDV